MATDGYLSISHPRARKVVDKTPIYVIDDFLTAEECDRLIDLGRDKVVTSTFLGPKISEHIRDSSSYYAINGAEWVSEKVSELTGKTIKEQEAPQICRYLKGEQYTPHYDYFHVGTESGDTAMKAGGQRVATVLIYLNDCKEGGHTYFPKLDIGFQPKKGTALVFFPCKANGEIDTLTLHAALPAVDEKWVSQVWVRQNVRW